MCLTADMYLIADQVVGSSIPARSHTFAKIDHEIISTTILPPSAWSRRVVVSYKRKYVHELLVNHLVKLAQVKRVVKWTDHPDMTIAVDWDVKHQTNTPSPPPPPKITLKFYLTGHTGIRFIQMFIILILWNIHVYREAKSKQYVSRDIRKPTMWHKKTNNQSLHWKILGQKLLTESTVKTDQTVHLPRLIRFFAWSTVKSA